MSLKNLTVPEDKVLKANEQTNAKTKEHNNKGKSKDRSQLKGLPMQSWNSVSSKINNKWGERNKSSMQKNSKYLMYDILPSRKQSITPIS